MPRSLIAFGIIWVATVLVLLLGAPWISLLSERVIETILPGTFPVEVVQALPPEKIRPPKPLPARFHAHDRMQVSPMFNGMSLKMQVTSSEGQTAVQERGAPESYQLGLSLAVRVPKAALSADELVLGDPTLKQSLPGLDALVQTAVVSPYYHAFYQNKIAFTESRLKIFNQLLTKHNFFDCQSILETAVPSGRRVLLVQSEMDVVTDGTDTDRTLEYDDSSSSFQPYTSYNWPRHNRAIPHPLVAKRQEELAKLKEQLSAGGIAEAKVKAAEERVSQINAELSALKHRSSLVATLDPFIVLPSFMLGRGGEAQSPAIGDYALVVHGGKVMSAIVGDAGPNTKIGEASLLICRQIDPACNGRRRPVSDLAVTYLIFPGTADKPFKRPNLAAWDAKCRELAAEIGGVGGQWVEWGMDAAPQGEAVPQPSVQAWIR